MGGSGGESENLEPNLTPMLDLVLQILMFFIATTSMSAEQVNQDIVLPGAQFAKPIGNSPEEFLYLNLDYNERMAEDLKKPIHVLSVLGKPDQTMDKEPGDPRDVRLLLQSVFDDIKRNSGGKVDVVVVVRADQLATYKEVFNLIKLCQEIGFKKLSVRAYINT